MSVQTSSCEQKFYDHTTTNKLKIIVLNAAKVCVINKKNYIFCWSTAHRGDWLNSDGEIDIARKIIEQ